MNGKFTATYQLLTPDVRIAEGLAFHSSTFLPAGGTVSLENSDSGIDLTLQFPASESRSALRISDDYAKRLADYLSLWFAEHFSRAVEPRRTRTSFQAAPSAIGTPLEALSEEIVVQDVVAARLTTRIRAKRITDGLSDLDARLQTPVPATSADLRAAMDMYFVGMRTENQVVRFLILYSALMLFGVFKGKPGNQATVDLLLQAEDPAIGFLPPPQGSRKTKPESIFTSARNAFIHAEGRGRDPAGASTTLEQLLPSFQQVAARILRKG